MHSLSGRLRETNTGVDGLEGSRETHIATVRIPLQECLRCFISDRYYMLLPFLRRYMERARPPTLENASNPSTSFCTRPITDRTSPLVRHCTVCSLIKNQTSILRR